LGKDPYRSKSYKTLATDRLLISKICWLLCPPNPPCRRRRARTGGARACSRTTSLRSGVMCVTELKTVSTGAKYSSSDSSNDSSSDDSSHYRAATTTASGCAGRRGRAVLSRTTRSSSSGVSERRARTEVRIIVMHQQFTHHNSLLYRILSTGKKKSMLT
jgi:hypothetical protein